MEQGNRREVLIFRNFREDHRQSMEVYADYLAAHLPAAGLAVREFRPRLGLVCRLLPHWGNLRMRAARFLSYPMQARRAGAAAVHHIVEHGYAHLLRVLDPRRTVVTVHDLIPLLAWRGEIPGMRYPHRPRLLEHALGCLRRAGRIIVISDQTRKDLARLCGLDPGRIEVVYYGLGGAYRPMEPGERHEVRRKLGLPDRDHALVLITGQEAYKNQATSLEVVRRLDAVLSRPVRLVRLGRDCEQWRRGVERLGARDLVHHLRPVPQERMVQVYNSVDCLLFPSLYEGFGRPPLEAMACGLPVVCSNAAALPEVVGDAALTAPPLDVDQLARHVRQVLEDDGLRRRLVERGLRRAARFSWEENARGTRRIYQELLGSADAR